MHGRVGLMSSMLVHSGYTEKASPTRHRPEHQHNARSNRRKQCSPNETKPYSKPTLLRKRQTTPTTGRQQRCRAGRTVQTATAYPALRTVRLAAPLARKLDVEFSRLLHVCLKSSPSSLLCASRKAPTSHKHRLPFRPQLSNSDKKRRYPACMWNCFKDLPAS